MPAVCTCSMRSTCGYLLRGTPSKPISPMNWKEGGSLARPSTELSARTVSSRSRISRPLRSRTGTIGFREGAARPRRRRLAVRFHREGVDIGAAEAVQRRDQVGADALRHEVIVAGWSRDPAPTRRRRSPSARATSTRCRRPPPAAPSPSGSSSRRGSRPRRRRRRSGSACTPATSSSQPAASARDLRDVRALVAHRHRRNRARCRRPGWSCPQVVARARARCSRSATSVIGLTSCSEPLALPRPRGVRMAS